MIEGLVSTIIPVHNRPEQLLQAVSSVLDQDYRPIEILIIDDGSTDDTLQSATTLADRFSGLIRVASQENTGPGLARECGRKMADGEFIQYLDSDDVLLPGKFSAQVSALNGSAESDVAYGMTRFRHADGSLAPGPWKGSGILRAKMFPSFLVERWWDTPTPLYRRAICDRAGSWTDLRLEEDWEHDCRIAALGAKLVWCNQYVCEVRDHEGDRLCRGSALDSSRLKQRASSHELILGHALDAGIATDSVEMQHFARALFLLSRQCGAASLASESRHLFDLSCRASGAQRARRFDFRGYRMAAGVVGWTRMGRFSQWLDRVRDTI